MNKKILIIIVTILVVVLALLIFFKMKNNSSTTTKTDINIDNGDEKVDWDSLTKKSIKLGESLEITSEGVYVLTGTIADGNITVNTNGNVKLILNSVNITSNDGPAIVIEKAKNIVIETNDGTTNTLEDGENSSNINYDGCIYSKDDLVLQGTGTLNIISNYSDAVVSLDDLKVVSGTYNITSQDDGIRGKDSVYIKNGTFVIKSDSDAIKSTNDTDNDKGFIYIEKGNFEINSGSDGLQAEHQLIIDDATFNIVTAGGSEASGSALDKAFGEKKSYDENSAKGLKSSGNLIINGGTFTINSKDDAIHSNSNVKIMKAKISITAGDDGVHADNLVTINSGNILITKSYEGIEGENITINGGTISIVSSDDGINVSGGADSSSMGNRPGQNNTSTSSNSKLLINGGKITVNSAGDGLDSNGSIVLNDGVVYVDGPTNDGNGALDYDQSFTMNGGCLVAVGSSGMAQNISTSSKTVSIMFYLDNSYNDSLVIEDNEGNVILEYTPSKSYQNIVFASKDLKQNETYNLKIGGSTISSITTNSIVNSVGSSNNQSGQRGGRW